MLQVQEGHHLTPEKFVTCDAVFDKEAEIYFKKLAVHRSSKWESNYSHK